MGLVCLIKHIHHISTSQFQLTVPFDQFSQGVQGTAARPCGRRTSDEFGHVTKFAKLHEEQRNNYLAAITVIRQDRQFGQP